MSNRSRPLSAPQDQSKVAARRASAHEVAAKPGTLQPPYGTSPHSLPFAQTFLLRARSGRARLWLFSLGLAFASWPVSGIAPAIGIDPSWSAGLQIATERHMDFGRDVLFTYGPLGFLSTPTLWYRGLTFMSLVYVLAVTTGFCYLLLSILGRRLPLPLASLAAAVVAYSASSATTPDLLALTIGLAAIDLARTRPVHLQRWVMGGAVVGGITLLVKFSSGTAILVAVAILAASTVNPPDWRPGAALLAKAGGTAFVTVLALWVLTGQPLSAFARYAFGSLNLASGYVAMAYEDPGRRPEYVVALVLLGGIVYLGLRSGDKRVRLTTAGLALWITYVEGKHGFIRHDGHVLNFFFGMTALALVLDPPSRGRYRGLGVALLALTALSAAAQRSWPVDLPTRAYTNSITAARHFVDVGVPSRAAVVQAAARERMRQELQVDDPLREAMRRGGVQVDPWEASLVWLEDLSWDPVPVFQPYTAYTPLLDEINAERLRSDEAPELIVRGKYDTIDGRVAVWDSPAYQFEQLCRYQLEHDSGLFQVLRRTQNRCHEPELLEQVDARAGQVIPVPAADPDAVVYATIDLPRDPRRAVMSFLLKPPQLTVTLNGAAVQRLVALTAEQPHVMTVPASAAEGPGPGGRFGVQQLTLDNIHGEARVTFFRVPFAAAVTGASVAP